MEAWLDGRPRICPLLSIDGSRIMVAGARLQLDKKQNVQLYGEDATPDTILNIQKTKRPPPFDRLVKVTHVFSPEFPGPKPLCTCVLKTRTYRRLPTPPTASSRSVFAGRLVRIHGGQGTLYPACVGLPAMHVLHTTAGAGPLLLSGGMC